MVSHAGNEHNSFHELMAALGKEHERLLARTQMLEKELVRIRGVKVDDGLPAVPSEGSRPPLSNIAWCSASHQSVQAVKRDAQPSGKPSASRFAVMLDAEEHGKDQSYFFGLVRLNQSPAPALKKFVHNVMFEFFCGVVVLMNSFYLGLESNYMATHEGQGHWLQEYAHLCFNLYFLVELLLRILADGKQFFSTRERRWNYFDIALVISSLVDLFMSIIRTNLVVAGRPLRVIRLLRLLRTVRLFRSMKAVREFRKMLYAILSSMRTLFCSLVVMFFVVYFFAIVLCQGVTEYRFIEKGVLHADLVPMYGTLPDTIYTLFAAVSQGVSWNISITPLADMHSTYSAVFLVYVALVLFGVMNVLTSVFVESAVMSAQHYRELIVQEKQQAREVAVMHMREVFKQMDVDGSGSISGDEMELFLTEPDLKCYVDALGISAQNTRMLFRLVDTDNSGRIDLEEFCEGCLRLQGEAKSIDVHTMIFQVRQFLAKWSDFTEFVENRLSSLSGSAIQEPILLA